MTSSIIPLPHQFSIFEDMLGRGLGGGGVDVDSPDFGWLLTGGSTVILHIYCYLTITSHMIDNTYLYFYCHLMIMVV